MASKFDIKLTPASQRIIDRLAKAGKIDLRPTLNVVGIGYRKEVQQIFSKQQPRGEDMRWAPLSKRYGDWKAKNFPGQPILVRTGALRRSMTQQGAPGNITAISKTSSIFGTSLRYGIYHDEGAKRLPKRNFSEPSERRARIWRNQLEKDIRHNLEKQGIKIDGQIFE